MYLVLGKYAGKLIIDSPVLLTENKQKRKKICSECQQKAKRSVDSTLRDGEQF